MILFSDYTALREWMMRAYQIWDEIELKHLKRPHNPS